MARIPEVELERLKNDVSLERLVAARGVELQKRGADLVGRCPFHSPDNTPSLVVTPSKNLFRCFGCGAAGSVVDWVMKAEGVSFRHAVELLRADAPLSGPDAPKKATIPKLASPISADADDKAVLGQVADYYHQTLKASSEALAYLEKRGLRSSELIDHFKLGFSNRTLGLRLPHTNRAAGELLRGKLQRLGVVRESGHEHLNGSLVVPITDERGDVVGMYGRKVTAGLRAGTPLHMYLPGPHRAAFNAVGLGAGSTAIVCEAILDALTFWCAGYRNVIAAYGVEGFTPHHLAALKRHGVRVVWIAYDRDDAGDAAAELLGQKLMTEGFTCLRVEFPRGMDANAYAAKVMPAAKSLKVVLDNAAWMGAGTRPELPEVAPSAAVGVTAATAPSTTRPVAGLEADGNSGGGEKTTSQGSAKPKAWYDHDHTSTCAICEPPKKPPPALAVVATPKLESSAVAAPMPVLAVVPKALEVAAEVTDEEVVLNFGPRRYRVRGLAKALSAESLKVNLLVSQGEAFHVDTLELYSARHRVAWVKQAADELRAPESTLKAELGALLLKLEELQDQQLKEKLQPKKLAPALSDTEAAAAHALLKAPKLLDRILADFERCGVVGEETNKLVGYLAAVSRKLEEPLAVLIQSSSAAGKSSLMEAVLAFVPEEDKTKYSAMTGQSLFYMGDADLKHKVLAIVEEEGAARASYALKLLQSEGELTIASTGKDPSSGRLVTHEYRVEGPTQLFLTTTATELDDELLNRCIVLTVDEERGQTQAIHRLQREKQTLEGLLARRDRDAVLKVHQDAQRLLRPLLVANPFARQLTFLDDRTRTRRDFPKYLTLIRTLALLHQHQRPVRSVEHHGQRVEYVEVTLDDIATANRLAHQVLGRSLDDLPPQTRRLLHHLEAFVEKRSAEQQLPRNEVHFTRRELREAVAFGDTQLKLHLVRLVELELLGIHRGPRGGFAYELRYDGRGKDGTPFLTGLVDVDALRHDFGVDRSGSKGPRSEAGRPLVGPRSGGGRSVETEDSSAPGASLSPLAATSGGAAHLEDTANASSSMNTGVTA